MPNPYIFTQQVNAAVKRRGQKAKQLWNLASGFNPKVPPNVALANLNNMISVIRADMQDEARQLARDVENILRS